MTENLYHFSAVKVRVTSLNVRI